MVTKTHQMSCNLSLRGNWDTYKTLQYVFTVPLWTYKLQQYPIWHYKRAKDYLGCMTMDDQIALYHNILNAIFQQWRYFLSLYNKLRPLGIDHALASRGLQHQDKIVTSPARIYLIDNQLPEQHLRFQEDVVQSGPML